jgi:hypothetical protein
MIKRFVAALAARLFSVSLAAAATTPVKVKITSIEGKRVEMELVGEKADWFKKGAPVKFKGGVGRISDVTDGKVRMNSRKADILKVGDEIELDKGPATLEGC